MKILLDSITTIPAGVALKLSPEQIQARQHAIEKFGPDPDIYVGTQAMVFKAGEIIEISGDLQAGIFPLYDKIKDIETKTEQTAEESKQEKPVVKHRRPKAEPASHNID
jgi:hypothetical protein